MTLLRMIMVATALPKSMASLRPMGLASDTTRHLVHRCSVLGRCGGSHSHSSSESSSKRRPSYR